MHNRRTDWNSSADVVVVGYGSAGAAAAITAHDAGARVAILEKAAQGGGNTACSGGSIREYLDSEKAATYFDTIAFGTVPRELYRAFIDESAATPGWIQHLGGELERFQRSGFPPIPRLLFAHVPGSDGIGGRWRLTGSDGTGGTRLWSLLSGNVERRGVQVNYNSPASRLVTNASREVVGVLADSPNGQMRIQARRAVILTCGGFECNADMQLNYLGLKLDTLGCPGNTGDGIRMAEDVGADLWHMSGLSCALGYKVPGFDYPFQHRIRVGGYIYVDQHGKRFVDEAGTDVHAMSFAFCHLDHKSLTYPRIPSYVVFDETTRLSGPIILENGWASAYYRWSDDNSAEISRGWIRSSDSIRDLAPQIGVRADLLQDTVSHYNLCCLGGYDAEFGRRQETLAPISRPPFYAIAVWPSLVNTQGGPRRNSGAQVLDAYGAPISRLYAAGELGSIWGILYPGAGNITECLAFGRIAGRNAAAETPLTGP